MKVVRPLPTPAQGLLVLLASCLLLAATPAAAQWKWRDKNGQLHLSDVAPPADVLDKDILQRPGPTKRVPLPIAGAASAAASSASAAAESAGDAAPPATDNKLEAEVEAKRVKAEQDEKAKRKAIETANAATRASNCDNARRQATALESGQRMSVLNQKGEREVLDDKGRAAELQRARAVIGTDCR